MGHVAEHLGSADQAALLTLVEAVLAAPDLDRFAEVATAGILELVPGLSASYNEVNPLARRAFAVIVPDPGAEWFARFQPPFEAHLDQHPLLGHMAATGDTRALTWDDVAHGAPMAGTELHRCFYAPNGIESQLVVTLPAPPGVVVAFAVNRGPEGFTERDRAVLDALRPHLIHGYRSVQLQAEAGAMRSALEAEGWAVVLVGRDGRVAATSPGAAAAARPFGLDVSDGAHLGNGPLQAVAEITQGYDRLDPATPTGPLPVVGDAGALEAVVVPSPVGDHVVLLRGRRSVALDGLGLTVRQREVALALAEGATNQQIARKLGIAPGTVKKHLEAVYHRLGVEHRAAAVARVLELR